LVLPHGVLHRDHVDTLVLPLGPLDGEDAAVLGGLHSDPALCFTQQLAGEEELGGGSSQTPGGPAAADSPEVDTQLSPGLLGRHSLSGNHRVSV